MNVVKPGLVELCTVPGAPFPGCVASNGLKPARGLKDYAEGPTAVPRARMTLISNLLTLSTHFQQALLLGDLHLSERRIRALVGKAEWERQVSR